MIYNKFNKLYHAHVHIINLARRHQHRDWFRRLWRTRQRHLRFLFAHNRSLLPHPRQHLCQKLPCWYSPHRSFFVRLLNREILVFKNLGHFRIKSVKQWKTIYLYDENLNIHRIPTNQITTIAIPWFFTIHRINHGHNNEFWKFIEFRPIKWNSLN